MTTWRMVLATLVLASLAIASVWALRVPIFGEPDEVTHTDYALTLWSAGRLISAGEHPLGTNVSPDTRRLERAGQIDTMRFNEDGRVTNGYGTADYYRRFERSEPSERGWYASSTKVPYIAAVYPPGFYALEATVFGLAHSATGSVVEAFFAMRLACLGFLAAVIILSYATARELRYSRSFSLGIAAAVGCLPTVSASFGYVQPDNLSIALAFALLFLAVRARRRGLDLRTATTIGLLLALLVFVKAHIAAALAAGIALPMVFLARRATVTWPGRLGRLALVFAPAIPVLLVASHLERHAASSHDYAHFMTRFLTDAPADLASEAARMAFQSLATIYGGYAGLEFYHDFAIPFTSLWFAEPRLGTAIDVVLQIATYATMVLVLVRIVRACKAAWRLARRGRRLAALRLLTGDPIWNTYLAYLGVVLLAEIYVDGLILVQGRYLLPTLLGSLLCFVRYAPRAAAPRLRRRLSAIALSLFVAYALAGTAVGIVAIQQRFYDPAPAVADPVEPGINIVTFRPEGASGPYEQTVRKGMSLQVAGFAYDSRHTVVPPLRAIVDGTRAMRIRSGLRNDLELGLMNDERLANGGFDFTIPTVTLGIGTHVVTVAALEAGRWVPMKERQIHFTVVAPG